MTKILSLVISLSATIFNLTYACTHTVRLTDTYGDGWNGGIVKVQVNGVDVLTNVGSTFTSGAGPVDFTFNANTGDVIAVIETAAGSWPTEMRVTILDGAGSTILGPFDPTSGAGDTVSGSCPAAMAITAATVVQSSSSTLLNCSTNSQIVCLQITTTGGSSPKTVTQIQTNLTGTAAASNISSAKIYYTGTSSTFSTTTLFGSGTISTSTYNINGSQVLSTGINYFWLTYDLNNTGTVGNTVDAIISQFTASATNYTSGSSPAISTTNPAGTRAITICVAPGGVYSGLETWVRADLGITGTTPITAISNQNASGTSIVLNGSPNLNTSATTYNYNPYVDFTGPSGVLADGLAANRQFLKLSGYSGVTGINYKSLFWEAQLTDLTRVNTHIATVENVTNSAPANGTFHGDADGTGLVAAIMQEAYDITDFGTSAPAGTWQRNASNIVSNSNHSSSKHILSANCTTGGSTTINTFMGGQRDAVSPGFVGHPRDWKGPMAELIGYTNSLTTTERQKIHSYLAVKYGNTIATDYLSTTGSTVFTNASPYNNIIIGIGRDDAEALNQKQAHNDDDTVRIYLSTLAASNSTNAGSFSSDVSYVFIGANTGKMCSTTAAASEIPASCSLFSRIAREWKITKTNMGESFNLDIKLGACSSTGSVTTANLRLLVDDDGNFANGGTTCYYNGDGSGIVFTYSNPIITITGISNTIFANNSTNYFTIGSANVITPLPIELEYFDVKLNDRKSVDINWTTLSEINSDYFVIEKRTDYSDWNEIDIVDGAGNSNSILRYYSEDQNPVFGNNYYRLKHVDFNGSFVYSDIRSIEINGTEEIHIYPIPASNILTIIGENIETKSVKLLSSIGQEIQFKVDSSFNDEIQINVHDIVDGIYYLQITSGEEIKSHKIVISHSN